ncbi:MAG: hypothetical protein B7Y41_04930 [Hydrogenophilales bacterium 28-61-23]|nr:MAG: hypothetical protein B7Y41_04930 [Hydrogenophilales bacterium 28-61-23]
MQNNTSAVTPRNQRGQCEIKSSAQQNSAHFKTDNYPTIHPMIHAISASISSLFGFLNGGAVKTRLYYWLGVGGFLILVFVVVIIYTIFKDKN